MKITSVNLRLVCICVGLLVIGLMLPSVGAAVDLTNAIGIWLLDEDSGTIARDSSPNENHGNIVGAPTRIVGAKYGNALELNGSDDYIVVPHSDSLALTEAVSITVWAFPHGEQPPTRDGVTASSAGIVIKNDQKGWSLKTWDGIGSGEITWRFDVAGKWDVATTPGVLHEWQHLAAVYDRQTGKFFLNGELVSESNRGNAMKGGGGDMTIGSRLDGDVNHNSWFKGMLDDIAVFDTALTDVEVKDIMNNGLGRVLASVSPREKLATAWGHIKSGS